MSEGLWKRNILANPVMLKSAAHSVFFLSLIFAPTIVAQSDTISVAVSTFKNNTAIHSLEPLGQQVPELLKTELVQLQGLRVVERSRLNAAFQELALSQSGVIDSANVQKVGRMIGAEFVITGEISRINKRLRIDAHITRVETGQVFAEKVTGPLDGAVEQMVALLAHNIRYNLTGAGEHVEKRPVRSYYSRMMLAAGAGVGLVAVVLHSSYSKNLDLYNNADRIDDFDIYYDKANNSYKARNAAAAISSALVVTAAVTWLLQRREANTILAENSWQLSPFYEVNGRLFGVQLTVRR